MIEDFFNELGLVDTGGVVELDGSSASLRKSRCGNSVYLMKITTRPEMRGNGHASQLLGMICDAADVHGIELFLEAEWFPAFDEDADAGLTIEALADWYWRFGFRGDPDELIREPRRNSE